MVFCGYIMTYNNLEKLEYWLSGPSFLVAPDQWPTDINNDNPLKTITEDDLELKSNHTPKQNNVNSLMLNVSSDETLLRFKILFVIQAV